jgi:hypothetical protein
LRRLPKRTRSEIHSHFFVTLCAPQNQAEGGFEPTAPTAAL